MNQVLDESEVYLIRQQKLVALRETGFAFPNDFNPKDKAQALHDAHVEADKAALAEKPIQAVVAGRIMLRRLMGRAAFFHIQDVSGRIQIYIREDEQPDMFEAFKHWDLGDIVGVEGFLFRTNTQELSVHATKLVLLTKSLRPLPDKYHGLIDQEMRYRKRYVDLIANDHARQVFLTRSRIISACRQFMESHEFLEVETPMMHPIPGGAVARPFVTHHNTLDKTMYLRIAPELYLKRLIVGGFERVYEINRNFRNEGLSTRHNPEFTMMEFYQAYVDYHYLMDFTEKMLRHICQTVLGTTTVTYQGQVIDFEKPFQRLSVRDAILAYHPELSAEVVDSLEGCRQHLQKIGCASSPADGLGKLQLLIFEETVEEKLVQPTFITGYATEVSPLARSRPDNPSETDRFELFIVGRELANGFSELNDPVDQAARFQAQVAEKEAGSNEAMHYDSDYIEALEYGMPPTGGEGIGIDRLVMLLTDSPAIRDVILFPQLR